MRLDRLAARAARPNDDGAAAAVDVEASRLMSVSECTGLSEIGVVTAADFMNARPEQLTIPNGPLDVDKEVRVRTTLMEQLAAPIYRADDLLSAGSGFEIIGTGIAEIDTLLLGGYYCGELVELVGGQAAGKTQACLAAAAAVAGLGRGVVFIDSSAAFSAERLLQLSGFDADESARSAELLRGVRVQAAFDMQDLIKLLEELRSELETSQYEPPKLVLVDSIGALALPSLSLKHSQGHALLSHAGRLMLKLARDHSMVVLTTNFIVGDRPGKPALGGAWLSAPTMRLRIDRVNRVAGSAETPLAPGFRATLLKSARLPVGSHADFVIGQRNSS